MMVMLRVLENGLFTIVYYCVRVCSWSSPGPFLGVQVSSTLFLCHQKSYQSVDGLVFQAPF
jgi:hypothetical protein